MSSGQTPLIIDCGANIGMASVWFAETFPDAVIVAVEPDVDNFELLRRNTAVYGHRVRAHLAGIASEPGELRIVNAGSGAAALRVERADLPDEGRETVPAITIAQIRASVGGTAPFIVKIDIEGFQVDLFRSDVEWVTETDLIAMELEDYQMPWRGVSQGLFRTTSRFDFDYTMDGETVFCFRHV